MPKKKIKICFVCPKCYPLFNRECKSNFGGAEVDLYLIGKELAKDSLFEVSYIVADYGQPPIEHHNNIKLFKGLNFQASQVAIARQIWNALKKADADIYMIKTASLGVFLVQMFCKIHGRKFIYKTASDTECNGIYARKHFLSGKAFNFAIKRADKIICQNKINQEELLNYLNICSEVIPNAHDITRSKISKQNNILWVGRSAKVKQPYLYLELAKAFPDLNFTMICQHATGDTNYNSLIQKADAIKNLEFIQNVDFSEIDSYFAKAKLFVNTSETEGFPNTFIQACKNATPILTLNVNPDGFLDRFNCGKCSDGDWEKFLGIFRELQEEALRSELGNNARKYAEEKHDISKIIEDYKNIFKATTQK